MKKRPFIIRPLSKLDNYLLINKPEIWSIRTHLVMWFSILFILILAALCYVSYTDPRLTGNIYLWMGFVSIISIIAIVTWLIYLLRFNVFKRYGITTSFTTLLTFLLYFISSGFIVAYSFVPPIIETYRAKQDYSNKELISDVNNINTKICQLEYDQLPKIWNRDSMIVRDTLETVKHSNNIYDKDEEIRYKWDSVNNIRYKLISKHDLRQMIIGDSLQKVNDSTYILFNAPNFVFLDVYGFEEDSSHELFNSEDIFNNTLRKFKPVDKKIVAEQLKALIDKYNVANNDAVYLGSDNESYTATIGGKYHLSIVNRSIENILEKINRFSNSFGSVYFRFWFYISFLIALLIFIFRHSTTRTFFFSLLTMVVLNIFTSLLTSLFNFMASSYLVWLIVYFVVFLTISFLTFYSKQRTIVHGIAINFSVLILAFLPLIITSFYYEKLREQDAVINIITNKYAQIQNNLVIAEFAGPILLCILIIAFIHKLYKVWFALPEQ